MKETHKEIQIFCSCGLTMQLTKIQYNDFDCGMMGFLNCPQCKKVLMPSEERKFLIKEKTIEVEGEDHGWM